MDIVKACKIAAKHNLKIARLDKDGHIMFESKIEPTDFDDRLCEVMKLDGTNPRRRWQPSLSDLIAEDWIILD